MIVLDVKQGSAAWIRARLGIPTASQFSRILTRGRKASSSAPRYMRELLAEYFIGEPAVEYTSLLMDRGIDMEASARAWYEYERGVEVKRVGLCLRDDRMVGCSPDSFVGEDGLVEIKCPSAAVHIEYMLEDMEGEYWQQVQGQLYVTGRAWCDLVAYNPVLPPVVHRYERDEDFIDQLGAALDTFVEQMLERRRLLIERGCKPAGQVPLMAGVASDEQPL